MIQFDTAFGWLYQFDRGSIMPSARAQAAELMGTPGGSNRARYEAALNALLLAAHATTWVDERAECNILCARAAYKLDALELAQQCLQETVDLYRQPAHQAGVARWLLGHLRWLQAQAEAAASDFQAGIRCFEDLAAAYHVAQDPRAGWYFQRISEMQTALQQFIAGQLRPQRTWQVKTPPARTPPTPTTPQDWQPEYRAEITPGASIAVYIPPVTKSPSPELYTYLFQTFPVSENIPAGGFGPSGNDPNPAAYLQFDHAVIDGCCYTIHPLKRNGAIIKLTAFLNAGNKLNVVHIRGDSMNKAGIDDGDYVLVVMDAPANHGDIVVAGVQTSDSLATIKRLYRERGRIELRPESSNAIHQPIPITRQDAFRVIGLAVAVLKKQPEED